MISMMAGCGGAKESAPATQESAAEAAQTTMAEMESEDGAVSSNDQIPHVCDLEDGIYNAVFDTDSSMFRVNEACEGRGILMVKDGQMTIHVSLASVHIVNLYYGTAEEAKADEAGWLQPSTDTVTYKDGTTEEVLGFDIPVPALDTEYQVALIGTKGKWYDHKVSVSDPQPEA